LIFTSGITVAEHVQTFQEQIALAQTFQPYFINTHSGRDGWNAEERTRFFTLAVSIEQQSGVQIAHETHRGRVLFNPWVTRDVLQHFPTLNLCCDFSHWVCVCERLLEDVEDIIELAAGQCLHIHARVGYEEGPQVPDPRAPEYRRHLEAHERWWRIVWAKQAQRGFTTSTLTAEYGPPDYLHTLPYTQTPVANLGEICEWQTQREAAQFAAWQNQ
jgi:hypothetical protein